MVVIIQSAVQLRYTRGAALTVYTCMRKRDNPTRGQCGRGRDLGLMTGAEWKHRDKEERKGKRSFTPSPPPPSGEEMDESQDERVTYLHTDCTDL